MAEILRLENITLKLDGKEILKDLFLSVEFGTIHSILGPNASGKNSRGHVDCVEIVQGSAKASAIPIVNVLDQTAKATHEAAIGSVDKKQIETFMSSGLDEEQAAKLVVSKMLFNLK